MVRRILALALTAAVAGFAIGWVTTFAPSKGRAIILSSQHPRGAQWRSWTFGLWIGAGRLDLGFGGGVTSDPVIAALMPDGYRFEFLTPEPGLMEFKRTFLERIGFSYYARELQEAGGDRQSVLRVSAPIWFLESILGLALVALLGAWSCSEEGKGEEGKGVVTDLH